MIELIIKEYLEDNLDVDVFFERPEDIPASYVVVEKTGGSMTNQIKNAVVAVQSYAASLYAAAQLNEEVKTLMDGLIIQNSVSRSKLNSDYNFTDPTTKDYRYQCVYDITYY